MAPNKTVARPSERDPEQLANALTGWRLARGMTQQELAEASGASKSAISQIERNTNGAIPKNITLSRLAKALGVTIDELFAPPNDQIAEEFRRRPHEDLAEMANSEVDEVPCVRIARWERVGTQIPAFVLLPQPELQRALPEFTPERLRYLIITDPTMDHTLQPGDIALLVPDAPIAAGVYVLALENGTTLIRRITPQIQNGLVRVSCDNPRFAAEDVLTEQARLNLVARIVYAQRGLAVH